MVSMCELNYGCIQEVTKHEKYKKDDSSFSSAYQLPKIISDLTDER